MLNMIVSNKTFTPGYPSGVGAWTAPPGPAQSTQRAAVIWRSTLSLTSFHDMMT